MVPAPARPLFLSLTRAIVLIAIVGSAASLWSFRELRGVERSRAIDQFSREVAERHALTTSRISEYENALFALRNLFAPSGTVSAAEFARAARGLAAKQNATQIFEWVPVVTQENRAAAERTISTAYKLPVTFTQSELGDTPVAAGVRLEYYPITYIEPLAGNEAALGYDLKIGQSRADLERARQSRQMTISRQIKLVQDPSGDPAVVMIWPVWRVSVETFDGESEPYDYFLGFVQSVFRLRQLLGRATDRVAAPIADMLFVDPTDKNPNSSVLYFRSNDDHLPTPSADDFRQGISRTLTLPLGGREWEVIYRPRPGWIEEQYTSTPWWRALSVLTVTALVGILVYTQGRRTASITEEVEERTAELVESRRQIDNFVGSLPGMAYRCRYDDQMLVEYVSEGVMALTGYSQREFMSGAVHFRDIILPEDISRVRAGTIGGLRENREIEMEYRIRHRDGTDRWLLSRGRGIYSTDGRLERFEGLAIDITVQKKSEADRLALERKMLAGQKLESLGLLAGGIAHDFNNLLTGILGNANLTRMSLSDSSPVDAQLQAIESAALRAAELCRQMLAYAGQGRFIIEAADLSALVKGMLPLLELSIGRNVKLRLELMPLLPTIMADATQLRQIVMNLIINASDAIGGREGEVFISTGCVFVDSSVLRTSVGGEDLPVGNYVFLEVRDTGCGMNPETILKIFDPFFSTKFAGRGLGLAAVLGIVRGHRGALLVKSTVGMGSTFRLLLPPIESKTPAPPAAAKTRTPWVRTGDVLVVEDDAAVRSVACAMLKSFGFTPHPAVDGESGLEVFRKDPARFELVLLDFLMPRLSGEQTLVQLRALRPNIPVLLMSGYSESDVVTKLRVPGTRLEFVAKPFMREDLEAKLRAVLA